MWSKVYLYIDEVYKETFNTIDSFDIYIDNIRKGYEETGWRTLYYSRTISEGKGYGNLVCLNPAKRKAITYYWEYLE